MNVPVRADPATSRALARLLGAGTALGCGLVALGGIVAGFHGGLAGAAGRLDGTTLLRAGILVLILTPVLRVVAVAVLLGRKQDRAGMFFAITVLLLLALATALDVRR